MKKLSITIWVVVVFLSVSPINAADITEVDVFDYSWGQIELMDLGMGSQIIDLIGPSEIHVFFEGPQEGIADDNDLDGLDEVEAQIVVMNLSGVSGVYGPVDVELNLGLPQLLGEIEETSDDTTGLLDLPPFGPGDANSFFDVYITLDFPVLGILLLNHTPIHISTVINEKPPAPNDIYQSDVPVMLYDENANPTGVTLEVLRYEPNPTIEIDTFDYSIGQIELTSPLGAEDIDLSGSSEMLVLFEGLFEGDADDDDGDGKEEVLTEMLSLDLTGDGAMAGPVLMHLSSQTLSMGRIQETLDSTPDTLDLPPFTPSGTADSFFDIYFEIEVEGEVLHNQVPAHLTGVINEKPPTHGDTYQSSTSIPLFDQGGVDSGLSLTFIRYEPNPIPWDWGDAPDNVNPARYPTLAANNGARHTIVPNFMLGGDVDPDLDGQPTNIAAGDDKDGNDDEDGVIFVTWPLIPGRPAVVEVTASTNGLLYAWIDFNGDDSWAQVGDQIFDAQPLTAGTNSLVFQMPMTATANINTFSRFRFTNDAGISYDGPANDGEVEDHLVKIKERCGIKWVQLPDETENGVDISVSNTDDIIRTVADDFQCTKFGLITDVHFWCSWLNDIKGHIKNIHLSIYSDDPVELGGTDPENPYSKPDLLLWERDFEPGEFTEQLHATIQPGEYWWNPKTKELIREGDTQIWRIDLYIDKADAFLQEGSTDSAVVYWLALQVEVEGGQFGWKTRHPSDHYNDDAVWTTGTGPLLPWADMQYPNQHPYVGEPLDMAFIITTDDYCPARADLNCDGIVNFRDFAIFAAQWLQTGP